MGLRSSWSTWRSIASGIAENIKNTHEIAQEKLNLQVPMPSSIPSIYRDLNSTPISIYQSNEISEYSLEHFILGGYLFMGLCKPNRNMRTQLKDPLSSYFNKVVEKGNQNPNAS